MVVGAEGLSRNKRREALRAKVAENPFLTDADLADTFGVSVQTIRLDRMALGVPEVRERVKHLAEGSHGEMKALGQTEIVGDLLELELGKRATSVLVTTEDMVLEKSRIVRGHCIFAQADSLAIAVAHAKTALIGLANVKFKRPVRVGERLVARAEVIRMRRSQLVILVNTYVGEEHVFRGKFVVFSVEGDNDSTWE